MKINLEVTVGQFWITATCDSLAEADAVREWVYALEAGEERQAIVMADKPVEPAVHEDVPFDVEPEPVKAATVDDAVAAVKEYAAKTNPAKAREMMQTLGINRTNEITADLAPKVVDLFKVAA